MVKPITIRITFSIHFTYKFFTQQLNFNNAFLNGFLDEEVYMEQPKGFESSNPSLVYKFHKAFMVLNKPLDNGLRGCILNYFNLSSRLVNVTLHLLIFLKGIQFISLFMWMISSSLVVTPLSCSLSTPNSTWLYHSKTLVTWTISLALRYNNWHIILFFSLTPSTSNICFKKIICLSVIL